MPPAHSQEYSVNGKSVPLNVYEAAQLVNESVTFLKKQDFGRAQSRLKSALLLDPTMAVAHSNLGLLLARQGKTREAIEHLKKATQLPDSPNLAFVNLACCYQSSGNLAAAIDVYKRLIRRQASLDEPAARHSRDVLAVLEREMERQDKLGSSAEKAKLADNYLADAGGRNFVRWADSRFPLKVFIEPVEGELDGFDSNYNTILKKAFYDWAQKTQQKVKFQFVDSPERCDIHCFWTNDDEKLGDGTEAGETELRFFGHAIAHVEMALRAKELPGDFPYTENAVTTTCRHEIGHALGVLGHSASAADAMYFTIPLADESRAISSRDVATILALYRKPLDFNSLCLDFLLSSENWRKFGLFIPLLLLLLLLLIYARKGKKKTKLKKKKAVSS
ncbi:MAG: tetratricopeptide repeat protein [Candidatus Obscuribacterales bacterium]|nr:tetratricopeptide repeat protein [Candidatus Obscuribacterales bacterium]